MKPRIIATVFANSLLLVGCGGGGGGAAGQSSGGAPTNSLSLAASPPSVAPASPVTVNWATSGLNLNLGYNGFISSNFVTIDNSTPASGSVVDYPTTSATYVMNVVTKNNVSVQVNASVTVKKTSFRTLIVGDPANLDVTTVASLIGQASTTVPIVSQTMPSDSSSYDVLVVDASGQISPSDAPKIVAALGRGKGVVLLKEAARELATGTLSNTNVSSISSWFGGVTNASGSGEYGRFRNVSGPFHISLTVSSGFDSIGSYLGLTGHGNMDCDKVGPNTQIVTSYDPTDTVNSWAFNPPQGGRVFFAGAVSSIDILNRMSLVVLSGIRWAAGDYL